VALKKTNPHLKIIISIGGWQADGFSDAALTDRRAPCSRIVPSNSSAIRARRVDIDWEYRTGVAGIKYRTEDRQNFTRLLKALRDRLDLSSAAQGRTGENRYSLTIAPRIANISITPRWTHSMSISTGST